MAEIPQNAATAPKTNAEAPPEDPYAAYIGSATDAPAPAAPSAAPPEDPYAAYIGSATASPEDPYAAYIAPESSGPLERKLGVAGRSASGPMVEAVPALAGAYAGGKAGAAALSFFPPYGPVIGGVGGAVVGGISGALAGSEVRKQLSDWLPSIFGRGPEFEAPADRPLAYGIEAAAGAISFGAGFYGLARAGLSVGSGTLVQRLFQGTIEAARNNPRVFLFGESAAAASSGVASAMAEKQAPGQPEVRIPAEIVGGFLSPGRMLASASDAAVLTVRRGINALSNQLPNNLATRFTPNSVAAQQVKAGQVLRDYLKDEGVDSDALRQLLTDQDIADLPLTAGQKTGDPALLALETEISRTNERFRRDAREGGLEALETVKKLVLMLRGSGRPEDLMLAAQIRQDFLEKAMEARLETARKEAVESAAAVSPDRKLTMEILSVRTFEALGRALDDSRAVERSLWNQIPRDLVVDDTPLREAYRAILPESRGGSFALPKLIEDIVNVNLDELLEGGATSGTVTVGKLLDWRSDLLAASRAANSGSTPDYRAARQYDAMADAVLRALNTSEVFAVRASGDVRGLSAEELATGAVSRPPDDEATALLRDRVDAARAYSRALNDTYTRSFVGMYLRKNSVGDYARSPESMFRHATAVGQDATNNNFRDIDDAMDFVKSRYEVVEARKGGENPIRSEAEVQADVDLVADAQERVLRIAAAESIDPVSGMPKAGQLLEFKENYASTLERFPEVVQFIDKALKDQATLMRLAGRNKEAEKIVKRKAVLYKITGSGNPDDAIRDVITGPYMYNHMKQLARSARGLGPDGEQALLSAVFDYATRRGTNPRTGEIDLATIRTVLTTPLRPNQPTLVDVLKEAKIGDPQMYDLLGKFFTRADEITKAMNMGDVAADVFEAPDPIKDLVLRVGGATAGTTFSGGISSVVGGASGGSGLVAAQRGSQAARNIFQRLPQGRVRQFMADALRDPQKLAALLDEPTTQSKRLRLTQQLHAYILQTALPGGESAEEGEPAR